MEAVSFYSYKGGVGRSLLLANVAAGLARLGAGVVILDMDLEAPGLHRKLPLVELPRTGLVELAREFDGGTIPDDLAQRLVRVDLPGPGRVDLLAAGAFDDASGGHRAYYEQVRGLEWSRLLFDEQAVRLFYGLPSALADCTGADYLLIDARTGISEISGVATALMSDTVVGLTLNSVESIEGMRAVLRSLMVARRPPGRPPLKFVVGLTRTALTETEAEIAVHDLRRYMREPAAPVAATLPDAEPVTINEDPGLQRREEIWLADPERASSPLLLNYISVISRLTSRALDPLVEPLIRQRALGLSDMRVLTKLAPTAGVLLTALQYASAAPLTLAYFQIAAAAIASGAPPEEIALELRRKSHNPGGESTGLLDDASQIEVPEQELGALVAVAALGGPLSQVRLAVLLELEDGAVASQLVEDALAQPFGDELPTVVDALDGHSRLGGVRRAVGQPSMWQSLSTDTQDRVYGALASEVISTADSEWATVLVAQRAVKSELFVLAALYYLADRREEGATALTAALGEALGNPTTFRRRVRAAEHFVSPSELEAILSVLAPFDDFRPPA